MKCVFLDRDGVINSSNIINGKPFAPKKYLDFKILNGVKESIKIIKSLGFKISIFTNQPDVKKNKNMKFEVEKMHNFLLLNFDIDHIDVCYHSDEDNCLCRKPKPGMLERSAKKLKVDLKKSYVVGDRWSDILCGQIVGCKCFFINNNYKERQPCPPYVEIKSLKEFSEILQNKN